MYIEIVNHPGEDHVTQSPQPKGFQGVDNKLYLMIYAMQQNMQQLLKLQIATPRVDLRVMRLCVSIEARIEQFRPCNTRPATDLPRSPVSTTRSLLEVTLCFRDNLSSGRIHMACA